MKSSSRKFFGRTTRLDWTDVFNFNVFQEEGQLFYKLHL